MAEISDKHIERFKSLIKSATTSLKSAEELLVSLVGDDLEATNVQRQDAVGQIIEGVFNGQNMVTEDGKIYPIQANYASKSRLVQGDQMKLIINEDGSFTYKQIGPIDRMQLVGILQQKEGKFHVLVGERIYNVLLASVTHYKVKSGDQISISVPSNNPDAEWAAIESPI